MALAIFVDFFAIFIVPIVWLTLAYWQKVHQMDGLKKLSYFVALSPVMLIALFLFPANPSIALFSLIFFAPANLALFFVSVAITWWFSRKPKEPNK